MPYTIEPRLPFARGSHTSYKAAVAAAPKRGHVTKRYLGALKAAGECGLTDHEAAVLLQRPLSTINSVRNGAASHVVRRGRERPGPYGKDVSVWHYVEG